MACNNCYNGCVETTSDKCVRYTGENVEALSIANGDNLYTVEQALINAVVSFLDGTGIDITINPTAYCALVTSYLPECKPICAPPTAVELFEALVKAACDLQVQIEDVAADIATLNADYDVDCLSGVTDSSDTHAVLQAAITKICELGVDLSALALDVDTNYVKIADLNDLIQAYLDSIAVSTKYYNKMIPYTVVEYYGPLTGNFDATGAGLGDWEKIYLCNGLNGTPDKRGRVGVGVIVGVGGGALNPSVDPITPGNPNYSLFQISGANTITLNSTQIPAHSHTITDPGHTHFTLGNDNSAPVTFSGAPTSTTPVASYANLDGNYSYRTAQSSQGAATVGLSSTKTTGITVNNSTGGGGSHANIQPVLACYYIMYIP
jgi:microcystin-dependent protein